MIQTREKPAQIKLGRYQFDPVSRELTLGGDPVKLSAMEAKLLNLFCEHVNQLVERNTALNRIWKDEDALKGRSLNVYVSKLRSLLREDPDIEILNVHGEGYRMVVKG